MSPSLSAMSLDHAALAAAGLNLVAVFPLSAMPESVLQALQAAGHEPAQFRQLLLIGHAGKTLWQQMQAQAAGCADPVDTYTVQTVTRWLEVAMQGRRYVVLYPGQKPMPLQQLGAMAGWHHASPFWVGINQRFGSWFAYRALILTDSDFPLSEPWQEASPCVTCGEKPCLNACPAGALASGSLELSTCLAYRRQPDAQCRYQCLARNACPVGAAHRYDADQMKHHYAASLAFIEAMPH